MIKKKYKNLEDLLYDYTVSLLEMNEIDSKKLIQGFCVNNELKTP